VTSRKSILLAAVSAGIGAAVTALAMWLALRPAPSEKIAPPSAVQKPDNQEKPFEQEAPLPSFSRDILGDCTLQGVVMSSERAPIEGANVGIWLTDQPWSQPQPKAFAETGKDGRFRMEKINGSLPIIVWAGADGFASAYVESPACGQDEELVLASGGSLVINASDDDNHPIPGARVQIFSVGILSSREGRTDPSGRLRINGLSEGSYEIFAHKNDSAFVSASPVKVSAGTTSSSEVVLKKTKKHTLRILDAEKGAPIKDALAVFQPASSSLQEIAARTDEQGRVEIPCPTSSCVAWAAADKYITSKKVPLDPGETVLRLQPGGTVRGLVVDKQGAPILGATIMVPDQIGIEGDRLRCPLLFASSDGPPPLVAAKDGTALFVGPPVLPRPGKECPQCSANDANPISDENGQFVLTGLPLVPLSLTAVHPLMIPSGPPLKVAFNENGDVGGAIIVMKMGAKLTIRVLDDREVPVLAAAAAVFDDDGRLVQNGLTDTDGYMRFTGLPSGVRVEISAEDHIARVIHTDGLGKEAELEVTLEPAEKRLHGRVKDSRGFGIGNVAITARLVDRGRLQTLTTVSGTDGTFFVEGAGEGRYHVIADGGDQGGAQVMEATFRDDIKLVLDTSTTPRDVSAEGEGTPLLIAPDMHGGATVTEIGGEIVSTEAVGADNLGILGSGGTGGLHQPIVIPADDPADNEPSADTPELAASSAIQSSSPDSLPVTGPPSGKGGLPIDLSGGPGRVTVTRVAVGSRVEIAGLRKGARILTVDGRKVSGPSDAKRSLLGTIGTVVMLEVSDNPDGSDPYTIVVQRERIP
jgi:hypothetical protein